MTFNVVIGTMLKDESEYLDEWLCYYLNLGVEHFFIYDNNSTDNLHDVLEKYINAGLVTLIFWPKKNGQSDAFNHLSKLIEGKSTYCGFFDVDEFLYLKAGGKLIDFLSTIDADQVLIPWINVGYSGHIKKPNGLVIENFNYCKKIIAPVVQVKHFFKPNSVVYAGVHCSVPKVGTTIKMEDGSITTSTHIATNPVYKNACIYHYQTKSYEEFQRRLLKGEGNSSIPKKNIAMSNKKPQDDNSLKQIKDIVSSVGALKQTIERFAKISNNPHRYGLLQKNKFFYSSNIVLFKFLIALGNFLLGLSTPSRVTTYKFFFNKNGFKSEYMIGKALNLSSIKLLFEENINFDNFFASNHFLDWKNTYPSEVSPNQLTNLYSYNGSLSISISSISLNASDNTANHNTLKAFEISINYSTTLNDSDGKSQTLLPDPIIYLK